MKTTLKHFLAFVVLLLVSYGTHAQTRYTVPNVPNVQLQDYKRYVSDPEDALEIGDITILDEMAAELRDSANVQTAIVVLPAIDTNEYGSARDFANKLFNTWGIGDKETNRGLLILLLTADGEREIVFETGYGIEETLTDGLSKLIQTKKMIPFLKEGEYADGLIAGVEEVAKVFEGTSEFQVKKPYFNKSEWIALIWLFGGIIIILIVEWLRKWSIAGKENQYELAAKYDPLTGIGCVMAILFFPSYIAYMIYKEIAKKKDSPPRTNCDYCGAKRTVIQKNKPQVAQKALPGQDGMKRYHLICTACNHGKKILLPYKYEPPQTKSRGGGGSGSTTSGGGSRGGSWGGGRSGGGGASTKF